MKYSNLFNLQKFKLLASKNAQSKLHVSFTCDYYYYYFCPLVLYNSLIIGLLHYF